MAIPWDEFRTIMLDQFATRTKMKRLEDELWNLTMEISKLTVYAELFYEQICYCPQMVNAETLRIDRYIHRL